MNPFSPPPQKNLKKSQNESASVQQELEKALQFQRQGNFEQAKLCYQKILQHHPHDINALHLYGTLCFQQKNHLEAAQWVQQAIEQNPRVPEFYNTLGSIYLEQRSFEQSAEAFQRGLKIHPNDSKLLYHCGLLNERQGQSEAAKKYYQKSIQADPHYSLPRLILADLHLKLREWKEADAAYQACAKITALSSDAYANWATVCRKQEHFLLASTHLNQALTMQPDHTQYWIQCCDLLRVAPELEWPSHLDSLLSALLNRRDVEHQKAAPFLMKHLQKQDAWKTVCLANPLSLEDIATFLKNPLSTLFCQMLRTILLHDPAIEPILINIRSLFLNEIQKDEADTSNGILDQSPLFDELLISLSIQCSLTEYVYAESESQSKMLLHLERSLMLPHPPGRRQQIRWAVYSSHRSVVHVFSEHEGNTSIDPNFWNLWKQHHVEDPRLELQLKNEIRSLTPIDPSSESVQQHYEDNPYPQWLSIHQVIAKPLGTYLIELFPHEADRLSNFPHRPEVLIAGCGSGKHALTCAYKYQNARIQALDLSRSSLAYGIRQAQQRGLQIEFYQADILKLPDNWGPFDVIESGGVLHHLKDPTLGFQQLIRLLKPQGYMKIGLYSQCARVTVNQMRDHIQQHHWKPNLQGIRQCRAYVLSQSHDPAMQKISSSFDFHSVSGCRDLLFHCQETQYNLLQLQRLLDQLKLRFIGFLSPIERLKALYTATYPNDPRCIDLSTWNEFEQNNPDIFAGMYQFWVQKE